MKNRFLHFTLFWLLIALSTTSFATVRYNLNDFMDDGTNSRFSLVRVDDDTYVKGGLNHDLELGPFSLGIDINFYAPVGTTSSMPPDMQFLALRHVSYDHDRRNGFRWGKLSNVTFGQGLLIDNFSTHSGGTTEFSSRKAGFLGRTQIGNFRVKGMWTGNNVKAGRVQYRIASTPVAPLLIGGTYVTDSDGINDRQGDVTIQRPEQDGWSADLALPIGGPFLTLFTEYAELTDQGSGAAAGIRGQILQFGYRAEYRTLGRRFVPGYFNSTYEATPFNFDKDAPNKKINGFLVAANVGFLDNRLKAGLEYEDYEGENRLLTAAVGWKRFQNTVGVINYHIPFQGSQNAVAHAEILYITGGPLDYVGKIKRTYLTSSTYTESYSFGVRANLDRLFPSLNLPF